MIRLIVAGVSYCVSLILICHCLLTCPIFTLLPSVFFILKAHRDFSLNVICAIQAWFIIIIISKIGKIRRCLNRQSTERLIHAFVTSHVDYCNSLYSGLPNSTLAPLQHVQNTAARLVTKSRKHEHITPILNSLHWLPVVNRIKFKILLLVFKIKHGFAPTYLSDLLQPI